MERRISAQPDRRTGPTTARSETLDLRRWYPTVTEPVAAANL
jgi:hypothetical protein